MSRFTDHSDDDSPEMVLARGRWQHNARAALKGKRGRKALAELREALLALPGKRLISDAFCTVGAQARREALDGRPDVLDGRDYSDRAKFDQDVTAQGEGVCVNGALVWHRKVKAGLDPAEAFAALPTIWDGDPGLGGDPMDETAWTAAQEAGLTFTLAWELAYRNDETFGRVTPEERYERFLAWIDAELATAAA